MHSLRLLPAAALVAGFLPALAAAQVTPTGPFTGTHVEDFNAQNDPGPFDLCLPNRVFSNLGDLCGDPKDPDQELTFTLLGGECSLSAFEGSQQYWTTEPSDLRFDKPPTRFGGYFGAVGGVADGTARFYDTSGALVATETIFYPGTCAWTWNGWSFSVPIGRIEMEGAPVGAFPGTFYAICMDAFEVEFPGPCLATSGMVAGQNGTVTLSNATPFGQVGVAYSVVGPGPTSLPVTGCGNVTAALSNPKLAGFGFADAGGTFTLNPPVPPGAAGLQIWVHAVDETSCSTSNPRAITFQ